MSSKWVWTPEGCTAAIERAWHARDDAGREPERTGGSLTYAETLRDAGDLADLYARICMRAQHQVTSWGPRKHAQLGGIGLELDALD